MGISLKLITSIFVSLIVIVVGGACLGVTLGTTVVAISAVAEAWARGISYSVSANVKQYFEVWESEVVSATILAQHNNLTQPRDDAVLGKNWTASFVPFLLRLGSIHNFSFSVVQIWFSSIFWMFSSQSAYDLSLQTIEFMENLQDDTTKMTVGGFQYRRDNLAVVPYSAASNYTHEIFSATQVLDYRIDPAVIAALKRKLANDPSSTTVCLYPASIFHIVLVDTHWQLYMLCLIRGRSGDMIGAMTLGLDAEKELHRLLALSQKSPNGEAFIIQKAGSIAATTRPEPYWTSVETTATSPIPPHCSSTYTIIPLYKPPRLGCLKTVDSYPYAPLNAVGVDFATTEDYAFDFFDVGRSRYAISSKRLTTSVGDLSFNIVAVLPETDLDSLNNKVVLCVLLALLVAAVAITVALLVMHFLLKRLEEVQMKMIAVAQLKTLDAEEKVTGNEEEQDDEQIRKAEEDAVDVFFGRKMKQNTNGSTSDDDVDKASSNKKKGQAGVSKNGKNNNNDAPVDRSWISEVAHLEDAYAETVRSMTNFTRYVSRAVVSELIMQRKRVTEITGKQGAATNQHHQDNNNDNDAMENSKNNNNFSTALAVANNINGDDVECNDISEYETSVLFIDIESFSSIWGSNRENHDGVLYILHIYFKRMTRLIMGHGGIVDKFMGDSIMSYWGAPVRTEHHALLAALAALALLRESLRNPLKRIFDLTVGRPLRLRCGLSTGNAFVGTIGTKECVNYSIIGTPVTTAKHLQVFNKYWNTAIVCDATTMRKIDDTITHRLLCCVKFEEKSKIGNVYEVCGLNNSSKLVHERVGVRKSASSASTASSSQRGGYSNSTNNTNNNNNNNNLNSAELSTTTNTTITAPASPSRNNHDSINYENNNNNNDNTLSLVNKGDGMFLPVNMNGRNGDGGSKMNRIRDDMSNSNTNDNNNADDGGADSAAAASDVNVTAGFAADDLTIAFSDMLSVRTLGSNEGVEELLRAMNPEHSSLDNLLRWHYNRTNITSAGYTIFAEDFSEAARCCVECRFQDCVVLLDKLVKNEAIPIALRTDSSVKALVRTSNLYVTKKPPKISVSEDGCFFIRAFKLDAFINSSRDDYYSDNNKASAKSTKTSRPSSSGSNNGDKKASKTHQRSSSCESTDKNNNNNNQGSKRKNEPSSSPESVEEGKSKSPQKQRSKIPSDNNKEKMFAEAPRKHRENRLQSSSSSPNNGDEKTDKNALPHQPQN